MVGKILLILLGLILLALLVALLLPLCIRISYESGEFSATVRYAGKLLSLPSDKSDGEGKSIKSKKSKKKKTEEQEKPKKEINWEQISYSLEVLPKVLIRALYGTARRIVISPLKVHVLVACSDPADTAVLYGKLHGAIAGIMPAMHRMVRIREQDIRLFPDFVQERMDFILDIGIQIRFWDILAIALRAGSGILKWYRGFKKRASVSSANDKTNEPANAGNAA